MKKKRVGITVLIVVGVVTLVLVLAYTQLDLAIRKGVERMGPEMTGTFVTLEKVRLSPLSGRGRIEGLLIGNPEGFKTDHAIRVGYIQLDLVPKSLLTKTIVIKELLLDSPEITYEADLRGSNISRIQRNLEKAEASQAEGEEQAVAAGDEGGQKVVIKNLIISNGKIRLSTQMMQGKTVMVPLPTIHLKDLGEDTGGVTAVKAVTTVFDSMARSLARSATGVTGMVGGGAGAVADSAAKGIGMASESAAKGMQSLGMGDKTAESVKRVGDSAAKGVEEVGDAARKMFGDVFGTRTKKKASEDAE
ncbi:MAG: hypothetical protein HQ559_15855 [Lentisphaerae bacterium]|nr:hypothetical protein [Lentisphaerota bacterium]